jgi:hypothetical protein
MHVVPRPYGLLWYPQEWQSCSGFVTHHIASPSLPGLTIAPCVDSLLCYGLIRQPKFIL